MNKRSLFIVVGIMIIVLCGIGFWLLTQSPSLIKAQLVIDTGTVQVRHSDGAWVSANNGMLLNQNDVVKTGDNTSASIILFESSILRLDSNTEVTLQEIIQQAETTDVKIWQDEGRTWNTISRISGIDSYEIQTPVAVASVRGTSFYVHVWSNGKTTVGVGTGVVNVSLIKEYLVQNFTWLKKNESVTIDPEAPGQSLLILPFVKDDWILQNQQKDDQMRENEKAALYKRLEPYIPQIKEQYGIDDQEIEILVDAYLDGDFELPSDTPKWIRDIIEFS
ncbi:hypothetical protein AYK25_06320 [Thermoplasmatales archaeon SM1-50]|nr:MAG: hypothetical protein AYK25_06320 [Thermoplasmatales archaeon SM1-50]